VNITGTDTTCASAGGFGFRDNLPNLFYFVTYGIIASMGNYGTFRVSTGAEYPPTTGQGCSTKSYDANGVFWALSFRVNPPPPTTNLVDP